MKCLVVMPTYNERPNIEAIVPAVLANGPDWRVLIVDDGSPDGTGEAADALAARDSRVNVLHRAGKLGLGTAYRDGLSRALAIGCDYACTMDSDFSHDPKALPKLRELAETRGAAHGSRYVPGGATVGWSFTRKVNSACANFLTRLFLGVKLRDCTSGFRCYRRDVLEKLQPATLTAKGYAVLEELLLRCRILGVTPAEHPILFSERKAGRSKINIGESFSALRMLIQLRLQGWQPQPAEAATRGSGAGKAP
jgi:glycosyltransferase involved in cell wall biosynthesis